MENTVRKCNCPACQQANVFSDLFEVNQCNYCGTDLYLQMSEDDVIASCLEVASRSHRWYGFFI